MVKCKLRHGFLHGLRPCCTVTIVIKYSIAGYLSKLSGPPDRIDIISGYLYNQSVQDPDCGVHCDVVIYYLSLRHGSLKWEQHWSRRRDLARSRRALAVLLHRKYMYNVVYLYANDPNEQKVVEGKLQHGWWHGLRPCRIK